MKKHPAAAQAVKMDSDRSPEYFLPNDPRAGAYQPGVSYVVDRDLSPEKAEALVNGGGYAYCGPTEAPSASDTPEPMPEAPAEMED